MEAKKSWGHGIESTTSRLEPGSLTTRSTGSLFDIVGDFGAVGAILKKMAVFFKENVLRVNHFLDGGDLEENGCFP